jgi:hypothetical protein
VSRFRPYNYHSTVAYRGKLAGGLCETAEAAAEEDRAAACRILGGASSAMIAHALIHGNSQLRLAAEIVAESIPDESPAERAE